MRKAGLWPRPDYYRYISSRFWNELKQGFLQDAGNKCECCGCSGRLHVHHKHYRTLGKERREDVEVLCPNCHAVAHEAEGAMDSLTREYLEIVT